MSADGARRALRALGWALLTTALTCAEAALTWWGYDSLSQLGLHVWAWVVFVVGTAGAVVVCYGLCWVAAGHP